MTCIKEQVPILTGEERLAILDTVLLSSLS